MTVREGVGERSQLPYTARVEWKGGGPVLQVGHNKLLVRGQQDGQAGRQAGAYAKRKKEGGPGSWREGR